MPSKVKISIIICFMSFIPFKTDSVLRCLNYIMNRRSAQENPRNRCMCLAFFAETGYNRLDNHQNTKEILI